MSELLGRRRYERAEEPVSHRNGYEPRKVRTTSGTAELERPGCATRRSSGSRAGCWAWSWPGPPRSMSLVIGSFLRELPIRDVEAVARGDLLRAGQLALDGFADLRGHQGALPALVQAQMRDQGVKVALDHRHRRRVGNPVVGDDGIERQPRIGRRVGLVKRLPPARLDFAVVSLARRPGDQHTLRRRSPALRWESARRRPLAAGAEAFDLGDALRCHWRRHGLRVQARPRSATGPRSRRGSGRSPWCAGGPRRGCARAGS